MISSLQSENSVQQHEPRKCSGRNFPRNAPRNFTEYLSERPELTSPWHAGARECGTKAAR
jgi:hypothetical protein